MVTQMGFSDALGDIDLMSNYETLSSETKRKIESEVQRIVDEGRQQAARVLNEHRSELELIANALLEYEILSLDEVKKVLRGEKLPKMSSNPSGSVKQPELALPTKLTRPPLTPPPTPIPGLPPIPGSESSTQEERIAGEAKPSRSGGAGGD